TAARSIFSAASATRASDAAWTPIAQSRTAIADNAEVRQTAFAKATAVKKPDTTYRSAKAIALLFPGAARLPCRSAAAFAQRASAPKEASRSFVRLKRSRSDDQAAPLPPCAPSPPGLPDPPDPPGL